MKAPLLHVASLVFNEPLAILPEKLEAILHAIGPRLTVDRAALEELARMRPVPAGALQSSGFILNGVQTITTTGNVGIGTNLNAAPIILAPAAQMDDGDDEEDQKSYRMTPDGIAVIPVRGTLMKRDSWMSAMSGFSSYAGVAKCCAAAMGDPLVKGVLLRHRQSWRLDARLLRAIRSDVTGCAATSPSGPAPTILPRARPMLSRAPPTGSG